MTGGRYVYAAVADVPERAPVTPLTGVDDRRVDLVEHAGVVIACSEIDAGQDWEADLDQLEGRLRAHQRVIDALFERGALLPVRFGTVFGSEDAMRQWVSQAQADLREALTAGEGLAEWSLTVSWDPDLAAAQLDPGPEAGSAPRAGTAYLVARAAEQREAERLHEEREQVAARLHAAAEAVTRSGERRPTSTADDQVLRASYVLPRTAVDDLAQAITSAMEAEGSLGLHADLSGPWPPSTFAEVAP